ncbi:hypothetical protein DFH07DRAFT_733980 [Mycena maculata]|uniref:BTB domain-containing protein n=1 Tax=Mycena maculata TaxID=230809 RepID=A0AAD7JVI7_9AGAR|nr:hypothetical protein DFH07DRAFT_733980 [Mycena maculata]
MKDPDFYFNDGNIVLSAEDSENSTTYFRLHQSILGLHSAVFRDMFSIPTPADMEQHESIPLVKMLDDAVALRDFIALLYSPQHKLNVLSSEDFTLRMFRPTQLAKKYQVDWICKMVADELQKRWPTTLAGWDRIAEDEQEEEAIKLGHWGPELEDGSLALRQFPEPLSSIRLAYECDSPIILPFAFFRLLCLSIELDPDEIAMGGRCKPDRSLFTPDEWHSLALARERIGKWFWHQENYQEPRKDCGNNMGCEARTLSTWSKISTGVAFNGDFLQASRVQIQDLNTSLTRGKICSICKEKLRYEVQTLRRRFVSQLSAFFDLDVELPPQ